MSEVTLLDGNGKVAEKALKKLNLGSGTNVDAREDWINIDRRAGPGVNLVHDLTVTPWPVETGSCDRVDANHILEHIPHVVPGTDLDGLVVVMNECWRVLAPGGFLHVEVPTIEGPGAFQDPTHVRYFVYPQSFQYFARWPDQIPGSPQHAERMREIARLEELYKNHCDKDGPDSFEAQKVKEILDDRNVEFGPQNYHADYGIECAFDCVQGRVTEEGFARMLLMKPKEG